MHPAYLCRGVEVRFIRAVGQTGNLGISQGNGQDWGWFPVGDRRWIQKCDHPEPSGLSWRSGLERRAGGSVQGEIRSFPAEDKGRCSPAYAKHPCV